MKIDQAFPRKYATGSDLNGRPHRVTIESLKWEPMRGENKLVAYFTGHEKGIVLNRTLFEQIAAATGQDDSDNWPGCTIEIFPVPLTVAGQDRIGIRARAVRI